MTDPVVADDPVVTQVAILLGRSLSTEEKALANLLVGWARAEIAARAARLGVTVTEQDIVRVLALAMSDYLDGRSRGNVRRSTVQVDDATVTKEFQTATGGRRLDLSAWWDELGLDDGSDRQAFTIRLGYANRSHLDGWRMP